MTRLTEKLINKLKKRTELEQVYDRLIMVKILSVVHEDLHTLDLTSPENPNEVYVELGRSNYDIPVGVKFDTLIELSEETLTAANFEILKVSVKRGDQVEFIPAGFGGIGLVKFKDGIPKKVRDLHDFGRTNNVDTSSDIYMTTREVAEKILKSLKELD